jgi:hypothetical protein
MTAADMHKNAILVTLNISTWSARKYDKEVTKDTNEAHGADADAGRYNKKLLPGDAPEYKALIQHSNEMRDFHYLNTLPWNDDGARILTIKNYQKYTNHMRQGTGKFYDLLNDFEAAYPRLRADARARLNGMFKDTDYPEDIRAKFGFSYKPDPMPITGDLRVELPAAEMKILEKQVEERTKQRLAEAQSDAVRKLHEVVAKMVDRLKEEQCSKCKGEGTTVETRKKPNKGEEVPCWICNGKGTTEATFRDSLIENAREVSDVLKRINLTDDPKLEKLRAQTEKLATAHEPEALRTDAEARANAAEKAQKILDQMTSTYGNIFG